MADLDRVEKKPTGTQGRATPPEKALRWFLLVLGLVVLGGYLGAELHLLGELAFPLDDSWIHLTFARNLAAGEGLSYQGGEWMPASTAPLWTALLSLGFLLPGSPLLWSKVLGASCYLGAGLALFRLGRRMGLEISLAALAAALFYCSSWMAWSALSGMEISLFCLLTVAAVDQHLLERRDPRRPPQSFLLLGLATLTRPEGILLLPAALVDRFLLWRRPEASDARDGRPALAAPRAGTFATVARGLLLVAALLLPTLALFTWMDGSPLPTTFGTKAGHSAGWQIQRSYLLTVFTILFKPQPLLVLLAGGGIALSLARLGGARDCGLLAPVWLMGLPLGYALLSPSQGPILVGNFGRYFFPLVPFVILLGLPVMQPFWRRWAGGVGFGPSGKWRLPTRALLVLALMLPTVLDLVGTSTFYIRNLANIQDGDVRIARWLRREVPAAAVVAVQDVGAIGYFAPQRLVDLSALISPRLRDFVAQEGLEGQWRFLEEERPDLVIAFPEWAPALTRNPTRLRPILRLDVEDNITLGGDALIVYTTPWTRFSPQPPAGEPIEVQ